jgi:hypothetical protein
MRPGSKPAITIGRCRRQARQAALTEEWWSSWRRANALGWEYLDAVSGLFRMNVDALTSATRFMTPFRPQ